MFYVFEMEELIFDLKDIFPHAVRGSVAKSHWGKGRKQVHLEYWFHSDTAGGLIAQAIGDLIYLIEWDTNGGMVKLFAESDYSKFIDRVKLEYKGQRRIINKPVDLNTVCL